MALKRLKRHRKASRRPRFVVDLGANVRPVNKAKLQYSGAIMTHPKLAVVLAATLFAGSAGTALAQGTGGARAPSPGIGGGGIGGGGGTFIAPAPGIGTGASPGTGITPTPGIGTGTPSNITPTPGIGTTPNPAGTLTGGPPSGGPPGERSSSDKPSSDKPPNLGPARTLADIKEETEAGITYQPCPANVRFPNGQQTLLLSEVTLAGATVQMEEDFREILDEGVARLS